MTGAAEARGPLTERLADALRSGQTEGFGDESLFARSLQPLLVALGAHEDRRELIESLPHFMDYIGLVELRNMLVSLGYESEPYPGRLASLNAELYPCLFVTRDGRPLVLLDVTGEGVHYFDPSLCEKQCANLGSLTGTAYVFTDRRKANLKELSTSTENWTTGLWQRFRRLSVHLLAMTFLINLVAIVVPLVIMLIYDQVIGTRSLDSLKYILVGVAIVLFADFGFRQLRARLIGTVAGRLDFLIGVETFRQLLNIPPLYTERSSVAAQLARLRQFDAVRSFFTGSGASVALELPFAVIAILVIAFIAGPVAWVPVVAILIYIVLGVLVMPQLEVLQRRSSSVKAEKQRMVLQTVEGHTEIKAVGVEDVWHERFREISGECASAGYRAALASSIVTAFGQLVMGAAAVAVISWGANRVLQGQLSVGGLIATMALVWRVLGPLQSAYLTASRAQQIFKALGQINQLMRIGVEQTGAHSSLLLSEIRGAIRAERLSFRYGPDQDPAVFGVSFAVQPGEILTITGTTGSGKSTVLKLIAGMYRAQAGTVYLDDMDIRQMDAADLRRNIAYVPQEVQVFHGTIAQNLRLGNGLATDQELEDALAEAGILDEINRLPKGVQTRIGDNVTEQFPPGFIRGLGLARALLRKTHVVLLDEPGSSLDMPSDQRLVESLERMRGQRTVILVTHRPSHIRVSDRAVIMDEGRVTFVGQPDEVVSMMLGGK